MQSVKPWETMQVTMSRLHSNLTKAHNYVTKILVCFGTIWVLHGASCLSRVAILCTNAEVLASLCEDSDCCSRSAHALVPTRSVLGRWCEPLRLMATFFFLFGEVFFLLFAHRHPTTMATRVTGYVC